MGTLNEHMELEHMFTCDKCPLKSKAKTLLNDHYEKQHNFKCSHCNETRDMQKELNTHIETVHVNVGKNC